MPAFRNVTPNRNSGRLGIHIPAIYDKNAWQVPDHEVKVDPLDDVPISPSSSDARPRAVKQEEPLPTSLFDPLPEVDATSSVPARRNSHTRRREPGHIPRPRNAFIFFRSSYISSAIANGEGQQNELSKHAGKVWNKMSPKERRPFCELAAIEKEAHYLKHPDYVYSPGRSIGKGKPRSASVRKVGGASNVAVKKRKASTAFGNSSSSSSDPSLSPNSPVMPTVRPAKLQRAAARRAIQRFVEPPSPSPAPSTRDSPISDVEEELQYPSYSSSGDDAPYPVTPLPISYVPTSEIPELEFSPISIKEEEKLPEIKCKPPSPFHPHLDPVTGEYAYQEYKHDFISSSMPTLPYLSSSSSCDSSSDEVVDSFSIPMPTTTLQTYSYVADPSCLLSDNTSTDDKSVTSISSRMFNGELEGDSVMMQYTDLLDINPGSNEYFEMEHDPDASIFQFFNFD